MKAIGVMIAASSCPVERPPLLPLLVFVEVLPVALGVDTELCCDAAVANVEPVGVEVATAIEVSGFVVKMKEVGPLADESSGFVTEDGSDGFSKEDGSGRVRFVRPPSAIALG